MADDWLQDPSLSAEETLRRFRALKPTLTVGPRGTATATTASKTYVYGWCPGCCSLHRMDDCPDAETDDGCICCEAISVPEFPRRDA